MTVHPSRPFTEGFPFEADGIGHPVLFAGHGPAVILLHELPGFGPEFWRLAHRLVEAGFTVFAPALFAPADSPPARAVRPCGLAAGLAHACISREIHLFRRNSSGPLSRWLRALARAVAERCGHPRVGVVGLCLTGNFAWSVALEAVVAASVACEPSLPLHAPAALALSAEEEAALAARSGLPLMAVRFQGDPACRGVRFAALRALVGEGRLQQRVLPDSAKNPRGNPFPHAVLTRDLIDHAGEPTHEALQEVLQYLHSRLA